MKPHYENMKDHGYTHIDKKNYFRGTDYRGRKTSRCIYKMDYIDEHGMAHVRAGNAFGGENASVLPADTIEPWTKPVSENNQRSRLVRKS